MEILIVFVVIGIAMLYSKSKKQNPPADQGKTNGEPQNKEIEADPREIDNDIDDVNYLRAAYTSQWLFTYNEKHAYYKLKEIADKHNLTVFAKVRLLDLVTPNKNNPKFKTNLYRIQAKHVDFVLTKENLVAKYIIELDDSSHNAPERKKRDRFVDLVLETSGYKVLHTREIKAEEIERFLAEQ